MSFLLALLLQASDARSVAADVQRHFLGDAWEEALKAYARMPGPPPEPAPADPEAVRAGLDYRQLRADAHWQVSQAYARLERWKEALASFQEPRWRRSSWCGNGQAAFAVEQAVAEGVCLERLGRHAEALKLYFGVLENSVLTSVDRPASRIVELHAAAGELDELDRRLVVMDGEFLKHFKNKDPGQVLKYMEWSPSNQVRPFVKAARAAVGPWRPKRAVEAAQLPFPPIPADVKVR